MKQAAWKNDQAGRVGFFEAPKSRSELKAIILHTDAMLFPSPCAVLFVAAFLLLPE